MARFSRCDPARFSTGCKRATAAGTCPGSICIAADWAGVVNGSNPATLAAATSFPTHGHWAVKNRIFMNSFCVSHQSLMATFGDMLT
jgi:hypothetical protein